MATPVLLTDEQKADIVKMYEQGLGIATIRLRKGYNATSVRKYLHELGIMRTRKEGVRLRNTATNINRFKRV